MFAGLRQTKDRGRGSTPEKTPPANCLPQSFEDAGILQFNDDLGAVANYGSNTVSRLIRNNNAVTVGGPIGLAPDCERPDSVALTQGSSIYCGHKLR